MVYQPDNRYVKKFGHQYGFHITDPNVHLSGENVLTEYSYTKKEGKKYSFQILFVNHYQANYKYNHMQY